MTEGSTTRNNRLGPIFVWENTNMQENLVDNGKQHGFELESLS
jgi:hypothetical protein